MGKKQKSVFKCPNILSNARGSVLVWVVAVSAVSLIVGANMARLAISRASFEHRGWNSQILNSATRNSFSVVESALRRRLWEVPLDSNCMQVENFKTTVRPTEGMVIDIVTEKDSRRDVITMTATGTFESQRAQFVKIMKTKDVAQFLLFSKGDTPVRLTKAWGKGGAMGLIASAKRIYAEGKVIFDTLVSKATHPTSWGDSTTVNKNELNLILQGDRLLLTGGLRYSTKNVLLPDAGNPANADELLMLEPLLTAHGPLNSRHGGGHALIFEDSIVAQNLADNINLANFSAIPGVATFQKYIFPNAFFCGTPPLLSHASSDSGCFHSDISKTFTTKYQNLSGYFLERDITCLSKTGTTQCSDTTAFPKGFEAWKIAAGLESTLYTDEVEPISFPKITWDNMQALEEEAKQCGLVISAPEPSAYEDCDIADQNFLDRRLTNGGGEACMKMSSTTVSALTSRLANFSSSAYSSSTYQGRYGRRVIYSKVPLEIVQGDPRGLWSSQANAAVRRNLPFWFVSEKHFRIRPYQHDATSPLDIDPLKIRQVHFNDADPGVVGPRPPLKIVVLSPEPLEIVSPFHQPYTQAQLNAMYPVGGGLVKPQHWAVTDFLHHEDDGFKYGVRDVVLNNMALISAPGVSVSMRGLWAAGENAAQMLVLNSCMLDKPGDNLGNMTMAVQPATPHANAPPLTSRFYEVGPPPLLTPQTNKYFIPHVFYQQYLDTNLLESSVLLKGMQILVGFEDKDVGGNNLAIPERKPLVPSYYYPDAKESRSYYDNLVVDVSDRRFIWTNPIYFEKTPEISPGVPDPAGFPCASPPWLQKTTMKKLGFFIYVNEGRHTFSQQNPGVFVDNFGAIFAQPLLNIKSE